MWKLSLYLNKFHSTNCYDTDTDILFTNHELILNFVSVLYIQTELQNTCLHLLFIIIYMYILYTQTEYKILRQSCLNYFPLFKSVTDMVDGNTI